MRQFRLILSTFLCLLAIHAGVLAASAADMKVEARLIWGTNDETTNLNHKPLDPTLTTDLRRIFKWKNYVEITNRITSIPASSSKDLQMSDKCNIKLKNLGQSRIEVSCVGSGKPVSKGVHTLAPGKWLTLAGNDKNDSAWFIVLRSLDAKVADAKK